MCVLMFSFAYEVCFWLIVLDLVDYLCRFVFGIFVV